MLFAWRFITVMLVALSMALSFCHLMEMPPRLRWEPSLWMAATTFGGLYHLFGRIGAVIDVGAVIASMVLVFLVRKRRPAFQLTLGAASLMVLGLAVWFAFLAPMNQIMATWTPGAVPNDFTSVRDQWEYSHAVIAGIKTIGFASLTFSVLVETMPRAPV